MKKNWIYLFLSMAIVAMPMTSCSNDDDEPKGHAIGFEYSIDL